jgi:hypothetical protein
MALKALVSVGLDPGFGGGDSANGQEREKPPATRSPHLPELQEAT